MKNKMKKIAIISGGVVAATALFLATSFTTINSGEVGVRVKFGKASNVPVSEGINFKVPFVERIVKMNIKV